MSLARAACRELGFGLRATSREVARWRTLAGAIPDRELRADALDALARKRGNIHGAALFWTLPDRRSGALLRTLVAWEILADYLDCVSERGAELGIANGRQLHLALVEALQPGAAISDWYALNGGRREDGGYAQALVKACRAGCAALPGFASVAELAVRAARLTEVLALNHEPDAARREATLRAWAASELPHLPLAWFERTAGASAWLTVLGIVVKATRPPLPTVGFPSDAERVYAAYLGSIAPVGAMLDSYGDIGEDAARAQHSYIAHYPDMEAAVERIGELIARARTAALGLDGGGRHAAVLACMIAFYLSKDSVRTPALRESTGRLLAAGGPTVRALVPVLRAWRLAYGQRAA